MALWPNEKNIRFVNYSSIREKSSNPIRSSLHRESLPRRLHEKSQLRRKFYAPRLR